MRAVAGLCLACLPALAILLLPAPVSALPGLLPVTGSAAEAGSDAAAAAPTSQLSAEAWLAADLAATDRRTSAALARRLGAVPGLEDVEVEVDAGVATLRGEVTAEADRELAETLAHGVAEVVAVRNRLTASTRLSRRLDPALELGRERLQRLASALPLLLVAVLVVWLFAWLGRWLSRRQRLFHRFRRNPFLASLVRQVVRTAALLAGVLIALDLLGATALVGAVLGTAGVIGLALGFAFRDLVENYIASVLLSLRQPFAPHDHVVIDGHEGRVVSLNSRATILMTLEGNHLRLPNAMVFKSVMLNYTRNPNRQFWFDIGIGTGEDLAAAQRVGLGVLCGMPAVLDDPAPASAVMELGESSVAVRFFGWIDQRSASWLSVRSEALQLVKCALEEAGVDLPEPIYRVHLQDASALPAARRSGPAAARPAAVERDAPRTPAEPLPPAKPDPLQAQIASERADPRQRERDLLDADAPRE